MWKGWAFISLVKIWNSILCKKYFLYSELISNRNNDKWIFARIINIIKFKQR